MSPESIAFLDANRHHWDLFVRAKYIKNLDNQTREGLLHVVRKEFNPGYIGNLWCSECVIELLRYAYTQYDKWIEANSQTPK